MHPVEERLLAAGGRGSESLEEIDQGNPRLPTRSRELPLRLQGLVPIVRQAVGVELILDREGCDDELPAATRDGVAERG
ncbi:MAG TPA: hypothetical protein VFI25_10270 [Planctomycetota bacterium]|nr:hypothetical protein [Planctomycetota bacterium]